MCLMTQSPTTVGFIGAGQMGEPMIERLRIAGYPVTASARRPEVRERLAAQGVSVVDTPREAAAAGNVVVVCVFSDEQLLGVIDGPDGIFAGLREGAVLASHVTGTLATIHRVADEAPAGVQVLDAPVSGTGESIRAGRLTILAGGDDAAVQLASTVFTGYADVVVPTGALGTALAAKLVNNILFSAQVQLAADAVRLGAALGLEATALLGALTQCSGDSAALRNLLAIGGDVDLLGARAAPYLRKDVQAAQRTAAGLGVDLGLLLEVVRGGALPLTSD
jgi:3-hydroxyisobutyrate dehydrogenase-like beta-hydroxyacid dehydrogenase